MADPGGPFLQAALFCERVLQEQDGVVSAIRVIDRVVFATAPDGSRMQPEHPVTLLITLKAGGARGRFSVGVSVEKPSGQAGARFEAPVFLEGEDRGVNIVVVMGFAPDQEGLYWHDVAFQGDRITRIPLRAIFQPAPTVGPGE